jgi:NNP family nitrate/nitrite transporter-like MFS transporter
MAENQTEGRATVEEIDSIPPGTVIGTGEPIPFTIRSLWGPAVLNPINYKSSTLPILNLRSPHARNFHLSWLGFLVAFLSWFAFPPLIPEAIKDDLKLTKDQIGNSNIVGLASTLGFRVFAGPLVDRYGPRKVMAGVLILGAIPSGLAGLVTSVGGLYAIRFWIGILGATFVPCQAWTTLFYDKSIVGTANAFVGGWGNLGGKLF